MAQLLCRGLTLSYGQKSILEHLNFEINAGGYLCIVGENDSGGSTLMKTIPGLQPPLTSTMERDDDLRTSEVGHLPQQTLVQRDFPTSVGEIVLLGRQGRTGFWPFYRKTDRKSAKRDVERMGITVFQEHCYRKLSGKQQQCVLLARALCATGKMLLLDEPIPGLDPKVMADIYRLIQGLNEEGITIIMVSHDIAAAIQYASYILRIDRRVFFSTREEYRHSRLGEWFLQEESANV